MSGVRSVTSYKQSRGCSPVFTFCMIKGDPKSAPPWSLKPQGCLSALASLTSSVVILDCDWGGGAGGNTCVQSVSVLQAVRCCQPGSLHTTDGDPEITQEGQLPLALLLRLWQSIGVGDHPTVVWSHSALSIIVMMQFKISMHKYSINWRYDVKLWVMYRRNISLVITHHWLLPAHTCVCSSCHTRPGLSPPGLHQGRERKEAERGFLMCSAKDFFHVRWDLCQLDD